MAGKMQTISNIVKLKVNEFIETYTTYVKNVETKFNGSVKKKRAFYMQGQPGIGKSESLETIKANLEAELKKKVVITDVRLLLFNPVDLRGIPVPDEKRENAKWLKPEIFKMDPSKDIINILFLDEISAAPPSVQAAAYQITLDRKIGEHKLPDNCYVICAGNRMSDKSVVYKMPKALGNRLTHVELDADLDDWKIWAMKNGMDQRIIGYLNQNPSKLNEFKPERDENAFPTPRSWSFVNDFIQTFGDIEPAYNCIAGAIGLGPATEFRTWTKIWTQIPSIDLIIDGKEKSYPTNPSILYALSAALTYRAAKMDNDQLTNAMKYISGMPAEFSVLTIKDMLLLDTIKTKLLKNKEWAAWTNKYRDLIL
jgi:hypothetical protein